MREIEVGRIYRHFKGSTYYIRHIAEHTETGELMVVYSKVDLESKSGLGALKSKVYVYSKVDLESKSGLGALKSKVYVRTYAMFIEKVDKEKYPAATQEYRFELLER